MTYTFFSVYKIFGLFQLFKVLPICFVSNPPTLIFTMDEIDAELTRKAVEEILQDARLHREREERPQQERKMNPLGRTNKRFLGRTLNAMVRHNKRADEQSRKNCNKKLKELDERRYKQQTRDGSRSYDCNSPLERKRSRHLKDSSDTSASEAGSYKKYKKKHKRTKTKKKKKKKRHSRSRSSSLSTNEQQEESQDINIDYCYDFAPSVPFLMAPTLMDIQMQQFYQYKALMALGVAAAQVASNNRVQIVELHSSSPSLSDIKLDESTTSSEGDNDGAMLTINVTDSDDDEDVSKKVPMNISKPKDYIKSSIETIECDTISVCSVSSAESTVNAIDLTED